ncbi:MAG: aminotransferase class I/II-fold pyridoxal phosphate-dependent enzyme [Rhodocyclaceae bacterium]|nr:aminotransferase class I/II-fold pyridoxal phosphate-dependent enzyme [Pseudomonadota bacterium]MDQ7974981.1 aminotransferase class I/II-fold pyridoxal phosphate-dependent enzyme [Rhodocyclaceae bacterium]MDQ8000557.1 aminotransferase class I/II-fold pyridoxal phosphate-dependent enzyme [Pseudomonadota bacterium]MDQ8015390.1 aminotransferase class I/II-fold pyridoxal phosphate-dependent enzyme [Pseudomonadota bacterium]
MTKPSTDLIHHPYIPPDTFDAPQPGVFKASTVFFKDVAAMRARDWRSKVGYTYGLHGTPTTFTLEERLATLEGGTECLLVPSGLASIALTDFALLKRGDEVLIPDNAYGPNKALATGELANFGITHRLYDAMDAADLAAKMSERTRLVWVEAPGSVTMEFPDLRALVAACRARGVLVALDNTWGAGLAFDPFDLAGSGEGVDISVHALTKYPSGGGDVLMGSVVTRDPALHLKLKLTHMRMGYGVGVNDVEAVLRSLPSLPLRYAAHDRAARDLALWLAEREEVAQVLHPAVEDSPGHAHWLALCGRTGLAAGLFSIVLHERYGTESVDRFCDSLQLFRLGYSWGGPTSLVVPYDIGLMRDASVARWPHKGTLVRFSIGLEDVDDLRADLAQALARL